jgi:stage II sporulation SpoAA-like protein
MPVTWRFRGTILWLSVRGVVTNDEIEAAFAEALAGAPLQRDMQLLWDARQTQTPLTAEDVEWRYELISSLAARGVLSRAALLVQPHQAALLELGRQELWKALPSLESGTFADEAEALAWLQR